MGVAIVTGGSRGIGKAISLLLSSYGHDIAICYAGNSEKALETKLLCEENGAKVITVKADVSKEEDVAELFKEVKEKLGAPDILVNNAGITLDGLLIQMKEENFTRVLDTNLKGAFLCSKYAVKEMLKKKSGNIVNITSVVGIHGNAGQANYAASKAGLIGLTKSIAKEYGAKGIRCNAIAPGFIETEMTDTLKDEVKKIYLEQTALKRFGTAKDVADLVEFLISEKSKYITGQVISVDGGME